MSEKSLSDRDYFGPELMIAQSPRSISQLTFVILRRSDDGYTQLGHIKFTRSTAKRFAKELLDLVKILGCVLLLATPAQAAITYYSAERSIWAYAAYNESPPVTDEVSDSYDGFDVYDRQVSATAWSNDGYSARAVANQTSRLEPMRIVADGEASAVHSAFQIGEARSYMSVVFGVAASTEVRLFGSNINASVRLVGPDTDLDFKGTMSIDELITLPAGEFTYTLEARDTYTNASIFGFNKSGLQLIVLSPDDLNSDGVVGQDDLNIVLAGWGSTMGQDDLNPVLENWGRGTEANFAGASNVPSVTTLAVPEPGALWLMLAVLPFLYRARLGRHPNLVHQTPLSL